MKKAINFLLRFLIAMCMVACINIYFGYNAGRAISIYNIIGVVVGLCMADIISWVYGRVKQNYKNNAHKILVNIQDTIIEGESLAQVTITTTHSFKDKILSALKINFYIDQDNIRIMECEDGYFKFQFITDKKRADLLSNGFVSIYRSMSGLDKVTYN